MKSTHFIINKATTTFIIHFTSFFHFSQSHAAITLNHVKTIIIMAKKNANALIAESITNNTHFFQINDCVTHSIPVCVQSDGVKSQALKFNTSQNNRFAPYINTHHSRIYNIPVNCFLLSSGFLNNKVAHAITRNIIITHNVISLITLYIEY
jgi:hypothetical protein